MAKEVMIELVCGKDVTYLNIRADSGWNITNFLDHIEVCEKCGEHKEDLINKLNKLISKRRF